MLELNGYKKYLEILKGRSQAEVKELANTRDAYEFAVNKRNVVKQYANDLVLKHANSTMPVSLLNNTLNMASTLQRTAKQLDNNVNELLSQESVNLENVRKAKQAEQAVEKTIANKVAQANTVEEKKSAKSADDLTMTQYNERARKTPGFFATKTVSAEREGDDTTKKLAAMFLNLKNAQQAERNEDIIIPTFDEAAPLRVR